MMETENFKRAEFCASFMQSDWLLKQRTKMRGKKLENIQLLGGNFARLKTSANGKRAL